METEWMDDEEDYPPPDYAYRIEPEESAREIAAKHYLHLQVLWDLHHPRYPQARRVRNSFSNEICVFFIICLR